MKKVRFLQSFTLIELVTVMVIMMIMAGLVVGTGSAMRRRARISQAESMIAGLEIAITMFRADTGAYPDDTSNADMVNELTNDTGIANWQGPYIEFKDNDLDDPTAPNPEVVDPWDWPYDYDAGPPTWGNTASYNIWSYGPDTNDDSWDGGAPDADYGDDIHNW